MKPYGWFSKFNNIDNCLNDLIIFNINIIFGSGNWGINKTTPYQSIAYAFSIFIIGRVGNVVIIEITWDGTTNLAFVKKKSLEFSRAHDFDPLNLHLILLI